MALGGTIKLQGESEYRRALSQITQNLREVSSEMKIVTSTYDKNDKSTEALTAKSDVLNKRLEEQKSKLKLVSEQYKTYQDAVKQSADEHTQLGEKLENAKGKLASIETQSGKNTKEYEEQKRAVDDLQKQYDESTTAQDKNKQSLSQLAVQMNNAQADVNKTAKEIDNLGKEMHDADDASKKLGDGFTVMKGVLSNLATDAIRAVGSGIKQMGSALVDVGKQALDSYANYEQLTGGIETMFGNSADAMMAYASDAYKTAQISANDYMETATSFSASLVSSLGGDTQQAAEYANRAIIDMSDNANKMGTSMQDIQNAYQGFAKGNYTMLDNLKLGYGGTTEEMKRLIQDASQMTDVQSELGVTVDSSSMSFANCVNAISVMQKHMGIAGTSAKEASTTIEGSSNMMKASWKNLLTGIADDNADFGLLINDFVESLTAFAGNIIPRVQQIIKGGAEVATRLIQTVVPQLVQMIPPILSDTLPTLITAVTTVIQTVLEVLPQMMPVIIDGVMQIVQSILSLSPEFITAGLEILTSLMAGIRDALPQLIAMLPEVISTIINTILLYIPDIIELGLDILVALTQGIVDALPQLIDMLPTIISTIVDVLISNLPLIIKTGITILIAIINGLIQALPELIAYTPTIISEIVNVLIDNLPLIISMGGQIIGSLISGIASMIGNLGGTIGNVATTIINGIKNLPDKLYNWGVDMIKGIANGIRGAIHYVTDAVSGVADKIKSFLHFSRPDEGPLAEYESWMPDMVEGLSESLRKASPELINQTEALANGMSDAFNVNGSISASGGRSYDAMVEAFKDALSQVKIEMDDEEMGHFVDKTVTKLIYN